MKTVIHLRLKKYRWIFYFAWRRMTKLNKVWSPDRSTVDNGFAVLIPLLAQKMLLQIPNETNPGTLFLAG